MKKIWIASLLAATAMAGQDARKSDAQPKKPVVQKLFILKYADTAQLRGLLRVFDASVQESPELHAITVEASPDAMRAIEDAIQKLDVPSAAPKNVEMTVYLLAATDSATPAGSAIPKDLDNVVTQLKNTFPFKNYGLLDVLTFRTRTGQRVHTNSSGGSLPIGGRPVSILTSLDISSISVQGDGSSLRVDRLNSDLRVPVPTGVLPTDTQYNYQNLGIQTDLDIKDGQKVVVGRLGMSHDQALFLVMVAKIL